MCADANICNCMDAHLCNICEMYRWACMTHSFCVNGNVCTSPILHEWECTQNLHCTDAHLCMTISPSIAHMNTYAIEMHIWTSMQLWFYSFVQDNSCLEKSLSLKRGEFYFAKSENACAHNQRTTNCPHLISGTWTTWFLAANGRVSDGHPNGVLSRCFPVFNF